MTTAVESVPARRIAVAAALSCGLLVLASWIGSAPLHLPLLAVGAAVLFLATVLSAEAGFVILIASMLFSPELSLAGAGGRGLEGSRSVVLRTDDLILLLIGVAWMARMAIHKDLGAIRRTRLNACIFAYCVCCLLSTLLGIEAGRVRAAAGLCFALKYIEYFIIFFITVNHVRSESRWRRLLLAVLGTAAAITAYAWWQMPQGLRPSAPFEGREGEPNTLGGYLVLMFSVACALAVSAGVERRWRRGGALLALSIVPPLLATLSRSSWVGLVAALGVLLVLAPARRPLAAALVLGAAVLLFVHPRKVEDRLAYTFQGSEPSSVALGRVRLDSSSSARLNSWSEALRGWASHPLAGWGITGHGFIDAQYFRVLVELGTAGFAAFGALLVALGTTFHGAFRSLSRPLERALGLGMLAGLAGLLAHAIGTNTFILIRIMEPFWLLTGLVVAAQSMETP